MYRFRVSSEILANLYLHPTELHPNFVILELVMSPDYLPRDLPVFVRCSLDPMMFDFQMHSNVQTTEP